MILVIGSPDIPTTLNRMNKNFLNIKPLSKSEIDMIMKKFVRNSVLDNCGKRSSSSIRMGSMLRHLDMKSIIVGVVIGCVATITVKCLCSI